MEWLLLTAIAAGVATSVALLWGFSGCDRVFGLERDAYPPKDLTATALSTTEIELSWTPYYPSSVEPVKIERTPDGGDPYDLPNPGHVSPRIDPGLDPNTTYFYRARTIGNDETSNWTDYVSARTEAIPPVVFDFQPSFEAAVPHATTTHAGWCIVQRIEAVRLLRSGTQLRLTISGSTNADLRIDRIFVSRVAVSGKQYDSATDLTLVAAGILIPAAATATQMVLPPVAYVLDAALPLLVAFDISPMNAGLLKHAEPIVNTDAVAYGGTGSSSVPRQEAGTHVRSAGYGPVQRIYLISKIEVA